MKSPIPFLAHGQILFFVWVILTEQKWVISRERRRADVGADEPAGLNSAMSCLSIGYTQRRRSSVRRAELSTAKS